MYSLSQAGMLYDIFGAGIIAWSFFSTRQDEIMRAMDRTWDEPIDLEGLVAARNDAVIGIPTLIFGFICQFVGPWILADLTQLQLSVGATSLLILISVGYALFRSCWIQAVVADVRRKTEGRELHLVSPGPERWTNS